MVVHLHDPVSTPTSRENVLFLFFPVLACLAMIEWQTLSSTILRLSIPVRDAMYCHTHETLHWTLLRPL